MSGSHSTSGIVLPDTKPIRFNGRDLKGRKNGELLRAAELVGYEVLLTVDQGIPRQLDSVGRRLSLILIHSRTNQIEDLLPLADEILQALETIQPGQTVTIPPEGAQQA